MVESNWNDPPHVSTRRGARKELMVKSCETNNCSSLAVGQNDSAKIQLSKQWNTVLNDEHGEQVQVQKEGRQGKAKIVGNNFETEWLLLCCWCTKQATCLEKASNFQKKLNNMFESVGQDKEEVHTILCKYRAVPGRSQWWRAVRQNNYSWVVGASTRLLRKWPRKW